MEVMDGMEVYNGVDMEKEVEEEMVAWMKMIKVMDGYNLFSWWEVWTGIGSLMVFVTMAFLGIDL